MTFLNILTFGLLLAPLGLQAQTPPKACDESQEITVTMTVMIEEAILKDLKKRNVKELTLTPAFDFAWDEPIPLKDGAKVVLHNTGENLALDLQEGVIVTYPKGEEDIVYAYCVMDAEGLKGELPKNVKLALNPALGNCKISVLSTQCPKKK